LNLREDFTGGFAHQRTKKELLGLIEENQNDFD
jgi:hypothetical protein